MPLTSRPDWSHRSRTIARARLQATLRLLPLLLLLAACARQGEYGYSQYGAPPYSGEAPQRYYPPPGPPEDPWGPYIREAATRYSVPEQWVRAVMQQESGGQEQAVSPVGAMGLMQVMPATYEGLRERYGLGDDPYDPHNNILAGTAYIHEMYDRYGAPGFLAAYNAGPDRVDSYLAGAADLPDETVNYLAAITPNLGDSVPLSGPLAQYASARPGGGSGVAPSAASLAAGCNLNAAYDPNHPCTSLEQAAAVSAPPQPAFVQPTGAGGCDLDVAYDPEHPCTSLSQVAAASAPPQPPPVQQAAGGCDPDVAYDPNRPCTSQGQAAAVSAAAVSAASQPARVQQAAGGCDPDAAFDPERPCRAASTAGDVVASAVSAQPVSAAPSFAADRSVAPLSRNRMIASAAPGRSWPLLSAASAGAWAIQVGAFANPALARAVAEGARAEAPDQLRSAILSLPPTPYGGSVLYRARLVHLSASAAAGACMHLNQRQLPCIVVQPDRS